MDDNAVDRPKCTLFRFGGHMLTVLHIEGKPHFITREVGQALDYADDGRGLVNLLGGEWVSKMREHHQVNSTGAQLAALKIALNSSGDTGRVDPHSSGVTGRVDPRAPSLSLLTEAGLYRVLMLSGKPKALAFQDWLEQDVLPQLRRTGSYAVPSSTPPAPRAGPRPGQARRRKALTGPRTLEDLRPAFPKDWEETAVFRFDQEGWVNPLAQAREHLIGRLMLLVKESRCKPYSWRLQALEGFAQRWGLALATFEGDPKLESATEGGWLILAQARDLFDRLSDAQLVAALATFARQEGVLAIIDVAQVRHEGWRWLPGKEPAEELGRLRDELARANDELGRIGRLSKG